MPTTWINTSPGDLSVQLPEIHATLVQPVVDRAARAQAGWAQTPIKERIQHLLAARARLEPEKDSLARDIAVETGKPIREATAEAGAVLAKFALTIADAERYLFDQAVTDSPHPAVVRRRPRGVAAVIAPFNFPLHLGHGANLAYLVGGNAVIFKPSPFAANVAGRYAKLMAEAFPDGVFNIVQGHAEEAQQLCESKVVRSICFTGSVQAGKAILTRVADDLAKDVALELGGKSALIVCADADLDQSAASAAEGAFLTAGQRCNATSRIIVEHAVADAFLSRFATSIAKYVPGDPLKESTLLGPLISGASVERFNRLITTVPGDWLVRGRAVGEVDTKRGHYVSPAVVRFDPRTSDLSADFHREETFLPIVAVYVVDDLDEALHVHDIAPQGLTSSIYTRSRQTFESLADRLNVGNVYANLPTTFSPSTLPFGGLRESGNRHPGGRGFARFVNDEQVVQTAAAGWT